MFNQLLEIAKTGVGRAIATDRREGVAFGSAKLSAWMNQQLEVLGVKLT